MSSNKTPKGAFDDLLYAVERGLEALKRGRDFRTQDYNKVWEMVIVRIDGKAILSIKSWSPELLQQLQEKFNSKGFKVEMLSKGNNHLTITKR